MPLPSFPTQAGAPGDGNLVAIHGGMPPTTEVIGGQIERLSVIETYPEPNSIWAAPTPRFGVPLTPDGVTLWLTAALLVGLHGQILDPDWAVMLARFNTVRAKMRLASYELFVYYHPAPPTTYRKFKSVNPVYLRSYWSDPTTLRFTLGAITTDKTLYSTAPGL